MTDFSSKYVTEKVSDIEISFGRGVCENVVRVCNGIMNVFELMKLFDSLNILDWLNFAEAVKGFDLLNWIEFVKLLEINANSENIIVLIEL